MFNVYGKQNIHLIFNVYGTKVIGIVKALLGLKQGVKTSSIQPFKRKMGGESCLGSAYEYEDDDKKEDSSLEMRLSDVFRPNME